MSNRLTVTEISERLDVDKEEARGLVRYLVAVGLVELKGERKPESGRGKAENVYSFEVGFEKILVANLKRAKFND